MAAAVRWVGSRWNWPAEVQRKTVHVGVGIHAMLLPLLVDRRGFVVFAALAAVALLILRLPKVATEGPGAAVHAVARRSWGDLYFLVALAVLFLRSAGSPTLYILPLAILTLSDTAAALVGTEYGRRHFGTDDRLKSIEGSVAFFVVAWISVDVILTLASDVPRANVVWLTTVVAAMAAVIEADSWRGLDNLFVPVGTHILLVTWGQAAPPVLFGAALLWLAVFAGGARAAPLLGLTPHMLRATFMAMFLTVGIADPVNAIPPAAALAGYLAARRNLGRRSDGDDLAFVAVLVLLGVAALIAGGLTGRDATEFYTTTFVALAAGYAVFAVPSERWAIRLGAAVAATAIAIWIHHWVSLTAPQVGYWMPRPLAEVSCAWAAAACALIAAWRPTSLLRREPVPRLAMLALAIPAFVYAMEMLQ